MSDILCSAASWLGVDWDRCKGFTVAKKIDTPVGAGCKKQEKGEKKAQISTDKYLILPLWSKENVQVAMEKGKLVYSTEVMQKPPFYRGSRPLKYESIHSFPSPGPFGGGMGQTVAHKFDDFTNIFIYEGGSIVGAVTFDSSKNLVAEARVRYFIVEDKKECPSQGIELEEFHYGEDGLLIFKCKSQIQEGSGFKIEESDKSGRKENEYYFIWPSRY